MTIQAPSWVHRILLATDFSRGASRAKDYALFLAHTCGAELRMLHVSQPYPTLAADAIAEPYLLDPVRKEVTRFLDELAAELSQGGVQATATHAVGNPSEQIIQAAQEDGSELIVVGTQGRTGLEHVLLGSTAERVVKGAPCPVLTVRSTLAPGPVAIERILLPLDFSDCSLDALEFGIQVARHFDASVTLLHVLEWAWLRLHFTITELAEGESARKDTESCLARYADLIRAQGLTVDTVIRGGGGATDFVIETAARQGTDLIVMGTHGRRGIQRALLGSVAEGILRQAPCPVITVKSPKFAPGHKRVLTATATGHRT
jgi:nucleotide-binding universal stress UspA family protein